MKSHHHYQYYSSTVSTNTQTQKLVIALFFFWNRSRKKTIRNASDAWSLTWVFSKRRAANAVLFLFIHLFKKARFCCHPSQLPESCENVAFCFVHFAYVFILFWVHIFCLQKAFKFPYCVCI